MSQLWLIDPRDPLVLGDGRGIGAHAPGAFQGLPLPGTMAGMVRAWYVRGRGQVDAALAAELLRIRVRGPWLVQRDVPAQAAAPPGALQHLFPVPSDILSDEAGQVYTGHVQAPRPGQGVLWQRGAPDGLWPVALPERDPVTQEKRRSPQPGQWPLEALVGLSLGRPAAPARASAGAGAALPTQRETRTHVAIDGRSGTAVPGQLYTSGGVRFREGLSLAVEVDAPAAIGGAGPDPGAGLLVLGGESRLSFRERLAGGFPGFAPFDQDYRKAEAAGQTWLRLQLLTPAYLSWSGGAGGADAGWLPGWLRGDLCGEHPQLPGVRLRLRAVCMGRAVPISGWDLQAAGGRGAPRSVRRLVPAGTVYYFELPRGVSAGDACAALWGAALEPAPRDARPDEVEHRAPAAWDGYGLVLPGLWRAEQGEPGRSEELR